MPNLTDLAKPSLSFKKGKPAFRKRRQIAEAVEKKEPGLPMANKFAIATDAAKKVFKKKNG